MSIEIRAMLFVSKVFARLHRWRLTAATLARVPLTKLDRYSVGRLLYALMMLHRSDAAGAHTLLHAVLRRNADADAELRMELASMATATAQPELAIALLQQAGHDTHDPHSAEAARKLLGVSRGTLDGSLQRDIAARIDTLHRTPSEMLVLVPVSRAYLDLWALWLRQVRRYVGSRVVAMAVDRAAWEALQGQADVAVLDVREHFTWDTHGRLHPRTRDVLWYLRVLVLGELVKQGHSVLVLDLDAVPVGNVQVMLANLPTADVVAQIDHSIPMDVERALGFVLCCGFMWWRPTAAARALLGRFAAETATERDDQLALNHLLARDGIVRRTATAQCMTFGSAGVEFVCPDPSLVSRSLEQGSVVRHFHQQGKSVRELRAALGILQ